MKFSTIIFILLNGLLILTDAQGQNPHKIKLGLVASPDYTFRYLNPINASRSDKASLRFRVGVNIEYELSNYFTLRSGIRYVNSGFVSSTDLANLTFSEMYDLRGLFIFPTSSSPYSFEVSYHDHLIELPLVLKYFPFKTQNGFHINGGLSILYFYRSSGSITSDNPKMAKQYEYSVHSPSPIISVNAGIGYENYLTDKYFFSLDILYRRNLTNPIPNSSYFAAENIYSLGMEVGLGMLLKK